MLIVNGKAPPMKELFAIGFVLFLIARVQCMAGAIIPCYAWLGGDMPLHSGKDDGSALGRF